MTQEEDPHVSYTLPETVDLVLGRDVLVLSVNDYTLTPMNWLPQDTEFRPGSFIADDEDQDGFVRMGTSANGAPRIIPQQYGEVPGILVIAIDDGRLYYHHPLTLRITDENGSIPANMEISSGGQDTFCVYPE